MTNHDNSGRHTVAIVGGGIAGLSTAYYLQKFSPQSDVILLEASERVGGKIRTLSVYSEDGVGPFVLEAGADAFLARQKPWAYELALELGMADRLQPTAQISSGSALYLVDQGNLVPVPQGLHLILPTDWDAFSESSLMSNAGKQRMARECDIPVRAEGSDESIADFVDRRFGREATQKLAEPLLSGIYSARPEEQSLMATFPRYRDMERQHGSLLRAVEERAQNDETSSGRRRSPERSLNTTDGSPPPSTFVSFDGGTEALPLELSRQVRAQIRTRSAVEQIVSHGNGYRLQCAGQKVADADVVVLAVPARPAQRLLHEVAPGALAVLAELRTVSTGVLYLAYRQHAVPHALDAYGVVVPRAEGRHCNALTFVSSKFAGRTPAGYALIRYFFGGARTPYMMDWEDGQLESEARGELRQLLGIDVPPVMTHIVRWWNAQPQYDVGHLERIDRIDAALPPAVHLIGTAYRGVGIPDCVRQGKETARAIADARVTRD